MIKGRYLCVSAAIVLLLAGCQWEPLEPPPPAPVERVFFMYDNIDPVNFDADMVEAGKAVAGGALDPAERVVVYARMGSGNVIYELVKDSSVARGYSMRILKKYAAGENSSLDTETIARIVGDVRAFFPDATQWGFAFGSHGKGWIPKVNPVGLRSVSAHDSMAELWIEPENDRTRYLSGYNQKIDISEFVDALDEWSWDFIILDDCFMASVEALYDMRTLTDYIIASPTEIVIYGFPYDRVVTTVFSDWTEEGFKQVGAEFVDYYRNHREEPYGTIAVVKMSGLDALAASVRAIRLDGYNEPDAETAGNMQTYEGMTTHYYYDFNQYVEYWAQNTSLYEQFAAQLERTVVYKGHTRMFPTMFPSGRGITPMPIAPEHYSGINAFIPTSATAGLTRDWQQTNWYKAVYGE